MAYRLVNRFFAWLVLLVFLAVAVDLARAVPVQPAVATDYLVRVAVSDPADLTRLADTGLPVFARLAGEDGDYVLLGAGSAGLASLAQSNLPYTILDTDPQANTYYLVSVMPNQPAVDWSDYGRVLLDDGQELLLRKTDTSQSLANVRAEISQLTFDPKPLLPVVTPPDYPAVVDPDPIIQGMIDQVLTQTVYQYDGNLSGEWPVTISGSPYTIVTRNSYSGVPISKAVDFVGEHLENLGLDVEYHDWHAIIPPNVIGQYTGQSNPDDIFIIGAHLDDMPSGGPAPGADDNASGSVGVLIAADIFTQFEWDCTLRFVLWTGEEQGLLGSEAMALRSYNLGENILGVLNMDMIAWNSPSSSPGMDLHARSTVPGSVPIAQLFSEVISAYNLNLVPQINTNGSGASDHASYWQFGYPAILTIEDFGDFNPYYHSANDLLENMDLDYFTEMVKASVATFAHMTGCMITTGQGAVNGTVTSSDGGSPIASATVDIRDSHGTIASTTTDGSGYYTETLFVGTYTVTVSASGFYSDIAPVVILTDTVTTLDFALDPIGEGTLTGRVTSSAGGAPIADATVDIWNSQGTITSTTTNASGYYTETLFAGTYTVTVSASGFYSDTLPVSIITNTVTTLDFALDPIILPPEYFMYLPTVFNEP